MKNLDLECAVTSEEITKGLTQKEKIKEAEPAITSALGVLQEDGVYAFYLYLNAKKKDIYPKIIKHSVGLLHRVFPGEQYDTKDSLIVARDLSENLGRLLMAKELLERTLVYARYHAKALGKASGNGGE